MSQSQLTIVCCDGKSGLALQLELWLTTQAVDDVHIVQLDGAFDDRLDDDVIEDVLTLVGESKRDIVRLCAVRVEPGSGQFDLEERLAERLESACEIADIQFVSGTICASDSTPYSVDDFHQGWSFNLLVVPHEGFGGKGFTDRPLQSGALPASAILCVLLATGSYSFMPTGSMDDAQGIFANDQLAYRLVRCHLRLVDMGFQFDDVMANALVTNETWPEPNGTVPHPLPRDAIAELATKVQAPLRLAYDVPKPVPSARTRRVGFAAAIQLFFQQFVALLRRSSSDAQEAAADRARQSVESLLQSATFGSQSDTSISLLLEPKSVEVLTDTSARSGIVRTLPGIVAAPAIAQPNTWRGLRGLLFGLADGSDFPAGLAGIELHERQQRAVVTNPRDISVPPWHSNETLDGPFHLSRIDAQRIGFGNKDLYLHNNDARSALALQSLARSHVVPLQQPASVDADESDDESASGEHVSPKLQAWISHRSHTLGWRLAAEQARAEETAIEDLRATDQRLQELPERIDHALQDFQFQRKQLFDFTLGTVSAAALLSILAMLVGAAPPDRHLFGWPDLSDFNGPAGALLLAAIASGIFGFVLLVNATRRAIRLQERFEYLSALPPRLVSRRQACANECFRLGDLYQQLLDWLDIAAAILHRPFGAPGTAEALSPIPRGNEFRNLVAGAGKRDTGKETGLALELRQRAVSVGWLDRAYRNYLDVWSTWYDDLKQSDGDAVDPDNDARADDRTVWLPGTSVHMLSARSALAANILEGAFSDTSYAIAAQRLRDTATPEDLLSLIQSVQSPAEPDGQSLDDFLGPLVEDAGDHGPPFELTYFASDTLRSDLARVDQSYRGSHLPALTPTAAGVDRQDLVPAKRSLFASYRFDVSQPLNAGQCLLVDGPKVIERPAPRNQPFDETDRG